MSCDAYCDNLINETLFPTATN